MFRWDGSPNSQWVKVETKLQLPIHTLVYAELISEHKGEWKAQRKLTTLHLIDAITLNGFDVRNLHLVERYFSK